MRYTDTDIRDWVGPDTYRRALELVPQLADLNWGEAARPEDLVASAHVPGKQSYDVTLYYMRGALSSTCTCPIRRGCRHGAAVALAVRERTMERRIEVRPSTDWQAQLSAWSTPAPVPAPERTTFCYRLRWPIGPEGHPELQLQLSHASSPSFQGLAWHLYRVGPGDAEPDRLIEPAIQRIRSRRPLYRDGATRTAVSWLVVPDEHLNDLLPKLGLHPRVEDEQRRPLTIHASLTLRASLAYRETPDGPQLEPVVVGPRGRMPREEVVLFGPSGARWAAWRGELYRADASAESAWAHSAPIAVPDGDRQAFEQQWLPTLAQAGVLVDARVAPIGEWAQGTPKPQLVLEENEDGLLARVGFLYGEHRVEAAPVGEVPHGLVGPPKGPFVQRDGHAEARWLGSLGAHLPTRSLRGEAALDFLETGAPALSASGWEIVGREQLFKHQITSTPARGCISVTSGPDWFDLQHDLILEAESVHWRELQRALETGARYVKLGSGRWARVPSDWLATQRRLRERLGLKADEAAMRVPRYQACVIAEALESAAEVRVDAAWKSFHERLTSFGGADETPVPGAFVGTLRPYQQRGLSYLCFLRDEGLHGILADDMGLGKTVQTAALLATNHPSALGPSLIVAPASLVENWAAELKRFVPSLRVLKLHGADRPLEAIADHDVVITTYATARQDLEAHARQTYHTLILDEAQAIKNPYSQTATAMRRLQARHRLALTGTPIENDPRDVWSLFAFLMPGYLGDEPDFRARFSVPIAIGDPAARAELKALIAPFVLRRLKSQVATDLPPRTDITVACELLPGQRRVYEMLLTGARERIQRSIESQGLERSRITILDALLKLRQACCHPALLGMPETMALESGKLEACMALIEELVAGGHRALVFSQFTRMLALLRERLEARGLAYEYLDGRTRDRQARVDRFNQGTAPLFLISLKAGGTGLNLTGADYVIHYDPWWNPASEDQATDRAHRIGQTRPVINYKLVTQGTIEEKLVALQQQKRELARELLAADATGKLLTADDLTQLLATITGP